MDHSGAISDLTLACSELARQYTFLTYGSIGETILKKEIPYLQIGKGKKTVLLIGGANAADTVSESLLMHFAADLCQQIAKEKTVSGVNCSYLYENRSIWILPRLNPDGNALVKNGADPSNPLYERQLRMNQMKSDFSAWQGNARGVIPTLNFGNDFAKRRQNYFEKSQINQPLCGEFPESEPESSALSRFIHTILPNCVAEFSEGDSKIYSFDTLLAKTASCFTGFSVSNIPDEGMITWFSNTYRRPSVHIVCPHESTPAFPASIYNTIRAFLFRLPTLLGS